MHPWFKNILLFVSVSAFHGDAALAQEIPSRPDSIRLYENIESYSRRSKFTKFIYRLIFKPVTASSPKKEIKRKGYKKLIQKPYSSFEGKIIRHIKIETLDPFGYSIADTIFVRQNFMMRAGNGLHLKSKSITIRNLLLIRQNQVFDSLLVKESERLVRSRSYVRDVSFFVMATSQKSDSVDIFIRELDKWSITPRAGLSNSRMTLQLNDKNFMGFGHEFRNSYTWYHTTGDDAYLTSYSIPNILNTYINTAVHYGIDEYRNFTKSISVNRTFFSPFAKWAGGVNLTQQFRANLIHTEDSLLILQNYKYNAQDYWAGNAMQMFRGSTEYIRTTNFISTLRMLRIRYLEKPIEDNDPQHTYSDENFYLGGVGISTRNFVQDKYIFNYGVTEDVPVGKAVGLTTGYQERNNSGRLYMGLRVSFGNYYTWGYFSAICEYGTFFRAAHPEQGIFSTGLIYFTGLFELGKWKFRQFAKAQFTAGINRLPSEKLSLNDGNGLDGFNSSILSGQQRLLFKLQTQSYAPWNLLGFRFGPYLIYSIGLLGGAATGFSNSQVYSQIGMGVLIKNDNLVFNTFQLSVSFYPMIPDNAQKAFKINSLKTTDFGFRDFEIGKPSSPAFQ